MDTSLCRTTGTRSLRTQCTLCAGVAVGPTPTCTAWQRCISVSPVLAIPPPNFELVVDRPTHTSSPAQPWLASLHSLSCEPVLPRSYRRFCDDGGRSCRHTPHLRLLIHLLTPTSPPRSQPGSKCCRATQWPNQFHEHCTIKCVCLWETRAQSTTITRRPRASVSGAAEA